ncbi:30S ribosomal protein THX [Kaistella sp.]|uniref:30S ribosomal protein THX n=1 Tax=Kaistella sp. TaxID=2782235 RepID=UPI0035A11320
MGKGDKKSRKGKIIAGSYGKKRPRKDSSVNNIPVKVLDEDDKKASKEKVRKEVGYPTEKSENAEVEKKPKAAAKPKAEKKEEATEAKPKEDKAKKTGE